MGSQPLGGAGNSWAFLQYVLGFRKLGFETYYLEVLERDRCIDEDWNPAPFSASANARYFRMLMERFDLQDRAGLLEHEGSEHVGLSREEFEKIAPDVDLLLNLSGRLHLKSALASARRRFYVDLDPGYTQIWQERYGVDMNLRGHDAYVTVGLNLGKPDCPLPTCGVRWESTLPPVVLDYWNTEDPPGDVYSTVAEWRGFAEIEWKGVWYGQKADEFRRILSLPRRVDFPLELCVFINPDDPDRILLEDNGWRLTPPARHAATPDSYRDYIIGSRGEFTAVKEGYSKGRTGWFSDRSACYLAAGRPVVVQETGFSRYLPTGKGLLTFRDLESAASALNLIEQDYSGHAAAARDLAREYFDSDNVLQRLLQIAGL